jgi:hypothetical protein
MVLKFLRKIERFEYYNPGPFWGITVSFCLIFNLFTGQFVSSSTINSQFTPPIEICRGGEFGSNQKKIFDLDYHRRLEKELPDWPERVAYQKKQKKIYESAILKKKEASKFTRIKKEQEKFWTPEEKDAVGYKLGKSQYAYYQDPSTPPNIFDRRQTLLLKMQDWHVQEKYLNSFQKHN